MWRVWETDEVHKNFWWRDLRKGDQLENGRIDWKVIPKWIFQKSERAQTIDVGQGRYMLRAFVNLEINLPVL
jgi:hypothetical protein